MFCVSSCVTLFLLVLFFVGQKADRVIQAEFDAAWNMKYTWVL